jgi:hypothetical protein
MAGIFLVGIGFALLRWFHDWPTIHAMGEASFIAGLLTIFVDPILKRSLAKEASRGIFHHLLGFDQEPEIRERLRDIAFDTKLCRRNYHVRCSLEPDEGGLIKLNVETEFDVVNYSNESLSYAPQLQFEKCERPEVCEVSFVGEESYKIEWPALHATEERVLETKIKPSVIKPNKSGQKYKVFAKYNVRMPGEFFYVFNFGGPTIDVSIHLESPNNLEFQASPGTSQVGGHYQYERLFMPGEHITIKWWRKF